MSRSIFELAPMTQLLGRLWLREISLETLVAMDQDQFRQPYEQLGGYIPRKIDEECVEMLAAEYCQLLVGPRGHISPVQSVWIENQFQTATAGSMNRYFELLPGFQPESNLSDHLGIQLEFMAALLKATDNTLTNVPTDEIASQFVKAHLEWTEPFFAAVESRTPSEFYGGLAIVTRKLVSLIKTEAIQ